MGRLRQAMIRVGVSLALSTGALALLGTGVAHAAGPDPEGTIYVADYETSSIDIFAPGATGNVAPERVISGALTGLAGPADVKVDSAGDVYSSNFNNGTITEYAPGAGGNVAPIKTIGGSNTGLTNNDDMSLAPDGTLYVGNDVQWHRQRVRTWCEWECNADPVALGLEHRVWQ